MENYIEVVKLKLKEEGYKLTPQRRSIVDIMIKNEGKHLNSEEIYDLVKVACPEIGLATVYRTLQLLDDIGAVSKLNLDDGCCRYEISTNDETHNHHHLICKKCNKIIEVEVENKNDALIAARKKIDVIMLDNFKPLDAKNTVKEIREINRKILIEISGGINSINIIKYAKFADRISLGYITQSIRAINFSLDII